MTDPIVDKLGPLAPLAGKWAGNDGQDIPPDKGNAIDVLKYREVALFEPIGPITNGRQTLYGLRYSLTVWPLDGITPIHEDRGFYLWDPDNTQVMRCFAIPRGISGIAGGFVNPTQKEFILVAEIGSSAYGLCMNKYLADQEAVMKFVVEIDISNANEFSYSQDTSLKIKGEAEIFHHTETNTLRKLY